jgi:asparaginyl-tRNA synthetase
VKSVLEADDSIIGKQVTIQGWVRTLRDQKKFAFIEVNDGSSMKGLQAVANADIDTYDQVGKLSTGAAVQIVGTIVESQGKGQKYEVQVKKVTLVGACPPEYPLQKKRHSQEYLRTIAHLRPRTNTIAAVARVRSALAYATHQYFQQEGFVYLQSPLITASDCEGAGEMFRVTTLPLDDLSKVPKEEKGPGVDFKKDFFEKPAFLTVSGQLSGETYATALGDIYTFGPTFRAENSQTSRHLAEFHMIEPEMSFCGLFCAMERAEAYIKYTVEYVLKNCQEDLQFFQKFFDKGLMERLQALVEKPFVRLPYKEAIALLQEEIAKDPSKWKYPKVEFGTDLATEHERWLAEKKYGSCVFVHNYPRNIKAFYMRDCDGDDADTCDSFDLLVPGVGELVGGSAREERLDVLSAKLKEFGLNEEDYWWYMDLRRFGSVPHAGFGLGFERLVCYVTGVENIREAIAYPRVPGSAEF